jgi:hypothetical protein
MGKRSSFERRDDDWYATPRAAVLPLVPWLKHHGIKRFGEPCAGDGSLVRVLEEFGLVCVYAADATPRHESVRQQDALSLDDFGGADCLVTNPPWSRPHLHQLILHLSAIAPVWMLVDADWAHTKQAQPFLPRCTDILPIGRVVWIPGTSTHGKDNSCWYRFHAGHAAGPRFHAHRAAPDAKHVARCRACGRTFQSLRSDAQTCSDACRQRRYRDQRDGRSTIQNQN